ncbi:hypothetical protein [Blattabacterium cuenoti]|uniref:hypothetical protein n=1 Tax=Blattabacterium cuenoti TaxID=1653831 RepID=UPI00163C4A7A|nr:hypothetical protein [Blattabacterium cuenoti]
MNFKLLKKIIIAIIIIGLLLIIYHGINSYFYNKNSFLNIIMEKKLWIGLYVSSIYFITLSIGSFLFLSIQNASKSGWSIIIHPIMEKISSFIPYGSIILFYIILLNIFNKNICIFNWMNNNLYNPHSIEYDKIIEKKNIYLNIPFFIVRNFIFLLLCNIFYFKIKNISKKLNISYSINDYKKLYSISIYFIIFFSITSPLISWDWIMSLNPHWLSTLFGWYLLSGFIVTGISFITIISIILKKKKLFPFFKESHLHDLSKYLFSSSLLWSYFWLSQFLLYWYGNIPEEIYYFLKREKIFHNIHLWILIPNFLIPLLLLMSKNNKKNIKIVFTVSIIVLIGHYINIYNLIVPDLSNNFSVEITDISPILIIGGLFLYIIFTNINNSKINYYGHPFYHESKQHKT